MAEVEVQNLFLTEESSSTSLTPASESGKEKKKEKRRSRYDVLEEKWTTKFSGLDEKMDSFFSEVRTKLSTLTASRRRSRSCSRSLSRSPRRDRSSSPRNKRHRRSSHRRFRTSSHRRKSISPDSSDSSPYRQTSVSPPHRRNSDSDNFSDRDALSIVETRSNLDTLSDAENCPSDKETISDQKKKTLFKVFGADATVNQPTKQGGMVLDQSQVEVLENSFRSKIPGNVTAFCEETLDMFPVDAETEKFLEVPSFDSLIESCLVKRHGHKASFTKKNKSLVTQPCKLVENIAYRGHQAARLGIVINAYIQQGLADLLSTIEKDSFDKDKAVQEVKDIFAMTTKCLDQLGRTGAFYHIIRRAVTMTDTGLYELDDASKFKELPLTGDGLFGQDLEALLKSRKEMKKQMDDLVPDISKKRKFGPKPPPETLKKPRFEKKFSGSTRSPLNEEHLFRTPRVPSRDSYRSRPSSSSQPPYNRGRNTTFTSSRRSSSVRGRLGKPNAQ